MESENYRLKQDTVDLCQWGSVLIDLDNPIKS